MREDPLTPAQRRLLEKLKAQELMKGFYLAGGSALALRLHHRQSMDHDFFRQEAFQPTRLLEGLETLLGTVQPLQLEKGTLTVQVEGVKSSFFQYDYPLLEPLEEIEGLFPAAGLLDIALMKLTAIADRGLRKDFLDLYAILSTGIKLQDVLDALPKKFPGVNYQVYHFLKALTYFEDAREEPLRLVKLKATWEEIQEFFHREVARISP